MTNASAGKYSGVRESLLSTCCATCERNAHKPCCTARANRRSSKSVRIRHGRFDARLQPVNSQAYVVQVSTPQGAPSFATNSSTYIELSSKCNRTMTHACPTQIEPPPALLAGMAEGCSNVASTASSISCATIRTRDVTDDTYAVLRSLYLSSWCYRLTATLDGREHLLRSENRDEY